MGQIEDFDTYKAEFLAANPQPREAVLLRRVRDNQLTWAPKDSAGHYDGHEVESLPEEGLPKAAKAAKDPAAGKKPGKIPKAGAVVKPETPPPGPETPPPGPEV